MDVVTGRRTPLFTDRRASGRRHSVRRSSSRSPMTENRTCTSPRLIARCSSQSKVFDDRHACVPARKRRREMTRRPRLAPFLAIVAILARSGDRTERNTGTLDRHVGGEPSRITTSTAGRLRRSRTDGRQSDDSPGRRVSAGGSRVRIRLSNQYGDRPLVIGSAHVALRTSGAAIDPRQTDRSRSMGDRRSSSVPAHTW